MCHTVIAKPLILSFIWLTPIKFSQLIETVLLSFDSRYSLPGFPEENYDTLEYSKVKCYSGDSVHLWNPYSIERKKRQQRAS